MPPEDIKQPYAFKGYKERPAASNELKIVYNDYE